MGSGYVRRNPIKLAIGGRLKKRMGGLVIGGRLKKRMGGLVTGGRLKKRMGGLVTGGANYNLLREVEERHMELENEGVSPDKIEEVITEEILNTQKKNDMYVRQLNARDSAIERKAARKLMPRKKYPKKNAEEILQQSLKDKCFDYEELLDNPLLRKRVAKGIRALNKRLPKVKRAVRAPTKWMLLLKQEWKTEKDANPDLQYKDFLKEMGRLKREGRFDDVL